MLSELMEIKIQPFDYQYLSSLLSEYKYPRNKVAKLISAKEIIALKKGLYVLGDHYNKPLSREVVANILYGPSYISLDYALSFYGLIPEKAYQITSVTISRRREYTTPLGIFTYQQLKPQYYSIGFIRRENGNMSYLIATPEKALCDKLYLSPAVDSFSDFESFIFEDMRVDQFAIRDLDKTLLADIMSQARSTNLKHLSKIMG